MFDDPRQAAESASHPLPADSRPEPPARDILDLGRDDTPETARKPSQDDDRRAPEADADQDGDQEDGGSEDGEQDEDERRPSVLRRHPVAFILGGLAVVALGVAVFF